MNNQVADTALEGPRPARIEDRDAILEMLNFVFRLSVGREPTIATDWPHVYEQANLENVLIITDQQRVVASTAVWPNTVMLGNVELQVGGINCVGTLPEYRKHGLGSQLMLAAHERMRDLGCHVGLLSTQITNWYRRLGWERAGVVRSYRLDRGNIGLLPRLPDGLRYRFTDDDVTAEIVRLRNHDRLGATRIAEKVRQLLVTKKNPRIFLAESEGIASAYLLLKDNSVFEWAGRAETVAGLVRACFEALDDPHISTSQRNNAFSPVALQNLILTTPWWQHPLVHLLDTLRIPFCADYSGMMYVVDPQTVLRAFSHSAVTIEAEGQEYVLKYGESSVQLNRNQLTKLIFGPERVSEFASDIFPLPFWQWSMERV